MIENTRTHTGVGMYNDNAREVELLQGVGGVEAKLGIAGLLDALAETLKNENDPKKILESISQLAQSIRDGISSPRVQTPRED
jgi:hypothetical protein